MNLTKMVTPLIKTTSKYLPQILSGAAVGGLVLTSVLTAKATVQAKKELSRRKTWGETKMDKFKIAAPIYIPAVVSGTATVACILGSNVVSSRRQMVIAAAYSIAETSLLEYRNKVVETLGEPQHKEIRDSIAQDRAAKSFPTLSEDAKVMLQSDGSKTLCYESFGGRYFRSNIETIRKAENRLNQRLLSDIWISLNEVYSELGIEQSQVGERLGWVPDTLIEFSFSTMLGENDVPCLVVDFVHPPTLDRYYS